MKTKDVIALWILVFFVLVPFGERFYEVTDALKSHRPVSAILWRLALNLIVGASGLFLISRFVRLTNDLAYYEGREKERETGPGSEIK